jgi:hypothetical protein
MRTACLLFLLTALGQAAVPLQPSGATGRYDVATWKQDWTGSAWEDGVAEGRVDVIDRGQEKRWRVSYAVGQIGPSAGGVAWNQPFAPTEEITLSYVLRFSPGFDWGKGGKLPGLGGGDKTTGGRAADGHNGFSVRPMWRADGKAEAYVYHAGQKGSYGDSFKLSADFRLPADEDIAVTLRVKLNHPEKADGQLELTFATKSSRQSLRRDDLTWRKRPDLKATELLFETFHGGSDLSWAPRRPCAAEFGQLRLTFTP